MVIHKIREQQFSLALVEVLCIVFILILAAGGLQLHWYAPIIFMSFESGNFAAIAISDMRGRKTRKKRAANQKKDVRRVTNKKAGDEKDGDDALGNLYISTAGGEVEAWSSNNPQLERTSKGTATTN
jgi:hypothetical protein